jgi:hypothetical protein
MKAIFRIDKKGNFDSFVYLEPGRVPPFIPPPKRDEAKDTGPSEPEKKKPKPS